MLICSIRIKYCPAGISLGRRNSNCFRSRVNQPWSVPFQGFVVPSSYTLNQSPEPS